MKSKVLLGCCYSFDPTRWIACAEACHPNGTREKGEDSMEVIQSSPHDDPTRKLASYTAGTVWKKNWQSDWVDTHIWIFYDLLSVSLFLILYLRVLFSFGSFPLFAPPSFFQMSVCCLQNDLPMATARKSLASAHESQGGRHESFGINKKKDVAKVRTNRLALQKVNLLVLICGQNWAKRLHILILWTWTCFILPSSYVTAKPFALHLVMRPIRTRSLENHEGILSFLRTHKSGTEESWTFFLWDKIRDSNEAWVFPVNWLLHFVIRFDCFLPGSLKFITRSNSPSFYFLFFLVRWRRHDFDVATVADKVTNGLQPRRVSFSFTCASFPIERLFLKLTRDGSSDSVYSLSLVCSRVSVKSFKFSRAILK